MPEQWFYRQDGQEYGPVTLQELKQRVDAGQIGPVVMVRKQGENNWRKAKLRRGQSSPGPSREKSSVGSSEASAATVPLDDPPQPPASASGERQATISPTEQVVHPVEKPSTGAPQVFISSTCEDLGPYRTAAREAAIRAGFYPDMSDDWAAKDTLPLDECLAKVAGDDVLVVIVAHRFGWVPEDQPGAEADRKSITWLECEAAKAQGMRVLAFLVDEDCSWDDKLRENYRFAIAGEAGTLTPELTEAIQRDMRRLKDFKAWLRQGRIVKTFTTEADLAAKVQHALDEWRAGHRPAGPKPSQPITYDPTRYLEVLCERTAHIDIRGLAVGSGKAMRFPIEELYIPLTTSASDTDKRALRRDAGAPEEPAGHTELHEALQNQHLVIVGDPGAGKTTFLRRIAQLLCRSLLAKDPQEVTKKLGLAGMPFPLCIRASDLARHMRAMGERGIGPAQPTSPFWLAHFLDAESKENETALTEDFFREQLKDDRAIVLLDGLDEAPSQEDRKMLIGLIEAAVTAYPQARFVVTSRPAAYQGEVVLAGFSQVWIDRLEDAAIQHFLRRWSEALFPDSPHLAEGHWRELTGALAARPDIRRIVRNPVMLTALAVVHWHEKRLPEQRADLYESILFWLAQSRQSRPGRPKAEECIVLLQELALVMQAGPEGRQVQVPAYGAAEQLARFLPQDSPEEALRAARSFLREEELDSGIVVGRGDEIRFWHLTFSRVPGRPCHRQSLGGAAAPVALGSAKALRAGMARSGAAVGRSSASSGTSPSGQHVQCGAR